MSLRLLFLIGAAVLLVLAVVATAAASTEALGVGWTSWLCGGLLSYIASLLVGERVVG
jgi:hypothetical protein